MEINKILFDILTPLGFKVHCTQAYWEFISTKKHPSLKNHENEIILVLRDPDEIRVSRQDKQVYLFYREHKSKWLCAVTKSENGSGFLITAYLTDAIKMGDIIWKKSK